MSVTPSAAITAPPLDPECGAALEAVRDSVLVSITPEMIPALREATEVWDATDEQIADESGYRLSERRVPGRDGAPDITLVIARPADQAAAAPAIYYVHGGGMVAGSARTGLVGVIDLAARHGAVVVSVDYRLAPEHPDPAPVEDSYAGLRWVAENVDELRVDGSRIVVAGLSAGGGVAAGTVLLARDRGLPHVAAQMLMCPMLDDRNNTVSTRQFAGSGAWDKISNDTGWTALLGERQGTDDVSIYASPARATDLSNLPPTFVDVGSAETFRDEAAAFASQIWTAGGIAELHVWPGGFHGYDLYAPHAAISQQTVEARRGWLARVLDA